MTTATVPVHAPLTVEERLTNMEIRLNTLERIELHRVQTEQDARQAASELTA